MARRRDVSPGRDDVRDTAAPETSPAPEICVLTFLSTQLKIEMISSQGLGRTRDGIGASRRMAISEANLTLRDSVIPQRQQRTDFRSMTYAPTARISGPESAQRKREHCRKKGKSQCPEDTACPCAG